MGEGGARPAERRPTGRAVAQRDGVEASSAPGLPAGLRGGGAAGAVEPLELHKRPGGGLVVTRGAGGGKLGDQRAPVRGGHSAGAAAGASPASRPWCSAMASSTAAMRASSRFASGDLSSAAARRLT